MAMFFPSRSICTFDTTGEKRLAERLEKKTDNDHLCWFNVPIGTKALQPDFIILHPQRGILILEVKDWKKESIKSANPAQIELIVEGRSIISKNPMVQAREYAIEVNNLLVADPNLRQKNNPRYKNNLIVPYGWGVVLTSITRKQFEEGNLSDVLQSQQVICQDEMTESADDNEFQQRLWHMLKQKFICDIHEKQIDRVRYHLFPEIRVDTDSGQFGLFSEEGVVLPNLIKVMDVQQEQLARSLGEGHRIIHGVAGSGKTMILRYRCNYLAQTTKKKILVLCYNKSLAGHLKQIIVQKKLAHKVEVFHFHGWCAHILKMHNLYSLMKNTIKNEDIFYDNMVNFVSKGMASGQIPDSQYSAILIDEGHDFEPDWLKIARQMVDATTNSLLVLYDDAQSIYHNKKPGMKRDFSFASVGIQAKGRTTILKTNYRNTLEVLSVARAFASELLTTRNMLEEDGVPVIAPESAGRRGPYPELLHFDTSWQEYNFIIKRIEKEKEQGLCLSDIAIICRTKQQGKNIMKALDQSNISYSCWMNSDPLFGDKDTLKIVSIHSSKGLEFDFVFIPDLGKMPIQKDAKMEEARLLYVAMTRSINRLVMTHTCSSIFTQRIQEILYGVRQQLEHFS